MKDVTELKEVPPASDVVSSTNMRHLLDMDMDDVVVKPNVFVAQHPILEWDPVVTTTEAVKGKLDAAAATKTTETTSVVVDVAGGEVCKAEDYKVDPKLACFKQELQELLVVYALKIELKKFLKLYQQRYARDLDFQYLGVDSLHALFQKVKKFCSGCVLSLHFSRSPSL